MKKLAFLTAKSESLKDTPQIEWTKGYKYWMVNDVIAYCGVKPERDIVTDMVVLRKDGWIRVSKYFSFDGPSGITIDTKTNMRAALIHDALYLLIRQGKLDVKHRRAADEALHDIMIKDGAYRWRARMYRWAVDKFGLSAATVKRKIYRAPKL